jgi:penicillin G amidase
MMKGIAGSTARATLGLMVLAAAARAENEPVATDRYAVPALQKPATVRIDQWGVAHVEAQTLYDAFVAQGFVAARDRLWQMDLWRKRGLGEMARDLGPAFAEGDAMARAVLYRGDMYREWLAYGSDAKRVAESFVAGVNAFVAETERDPAKLPEEFRILGYEPARWRAEDVVRIRHHGLTLNFDSEVARADLYCRFGSDGEKSVGRRADWLRRELDPPTPPVLADGFDPCSIPAAALQRAYDLATATPRFTRETIAAGSDDTSPMMAEYGASRDGRDSPFTFGSNNWTIAPARTTTGRPILANDPHRAHGAPSLRYLVHLRAPGLDVIGAGEPFLPGLSIGHNQDIAFGLTRFYIDQEDLYVYETNPENADEYRYRGRYEPMAVVSEEIAVKGEKPRRVELRFTRHGPVLYRDPKTNRAFALRAAWLDAGMAPYFGSIEYMRARNWEEFEAAMNRWGAPGENQVYADRTGSIGWIPAGLTPIRPNWDGLTPVPGDGRYEWAGYRDRDELPSDHDPARGYVVTANENNIPPDHPARTKGIGSEWSDAARSQRLKGLFTEGKRLAVADSLAWQNDTVSMHARRLVRLLGSLSSSDPTVVRGLELLRAWDGNETADSAAAAIHEVWFTNHLRPAVVKQVLPADAAAVVGSGDASQVLRVLEKPEGWMTTEARDRTMVESLAKALREIEGRLGPDASRWTWGALHRAVFAHPLSAAVDDKTRSRLEVGDWPIGGSGFTPMNTGYRTSDYRMTSGASFRMVLDVGNWDGSRAVNTPGQSGDPGSPHYRDLAPLWARGGYFPLVYSAQAVAGATRSVLRLEPAAVAGHLPANE